MWLLVIRQDSVTDAFLLSNIGGKSVPQLYRHSQMERKEGPVGQHTLNMIASTTGSSYAKDNHSNNSKNKKNNDC